MRKMTMSRSLLTAILLISLGCQPANDAQNDDEVGSGSHVHTDGTVHDDHGHSHADPPHGGTIIDWGGGKFHLEFIVNHDKQEATVYVLDDNVNKAQPIAATELTLAIKDPACQVTLMADPMEGEPEGQSSRFTGTHENLGIVKEFEGQVMGTVDETPYSGKFTEEPHDH